MGRRRGLPGIRHGTLSVLAGGVLTLLVVPFGCSDDAAFAPSDGGPPIDAPVPSDRQSDRGDAEPPDPPTPPGLPAGWELERSYDKTCRFYTPTSAASLPPPLRWETCPSSATPSGVSCKRVLLDGAEEAYNATAFNGWTAPDGKVLLAVEGNSRKGVRYHIVAEADGPALSAILETDGRCALGYHRVHGARHILRVFEDGSSMGGGAIGGDLAQPRPTLAVHFDKKIPHSVYPMPAALLDSDGTRTFRRFSWDDGQPLGPIWSSEEDDGLQPGSLVFHEQAAFWTASTSQYAKVKFYLPPAGAGDFLSSGLVSDRGFGDLGTDGVDLVWMQASGRTEPGPYPTLSIMTAPFAEDPAQVAPRRIRSEEGPEFGIVRFIVGCGYAARSAGTFVRIVRLSDGLSWKLEGGLNIPWSWTNPVALTCTELFATANVQTGIGPILARVRLDSLGPGIPAD